MANLARGIAAAADAGAQISMEQHRANIMAKRDEKLKQFDDQRQAQDQQYRTGERVAGQDFSAGEAGKNRAHNLEMQEKRNQGLLARNMAKTNDKVPAAPKFFSDKADKTFGTSGPLGQISYEGNNGYYAAQTAELASQLYSSMPEEQKDLNVAWNMAMSEFQKQQKLPEIDEQVDTEAKGRAGNLFQDPDYAGMTEPEWRAMRKKQLMDQLGMRENAKPQSGEKPAETKPAGGQQQAPQAAIDFLMKNPNMKDQFRAKYGYLPEGIQ